MLSYFVNTDKLVLKFVWKGKRPGINNIILKKKKKNKTGGLTLPDIKSYYKGTAIKIAFYCQNNRYIDQYNRIKSLDID